MKRILNSCIISFSMYSKIPMPKAEWDEDNMKYVMCFFPLVGAVIGAFIILWSLVGQMFPISRVLYTTIMVLIPLIITGGIHMDGFLDTVDAISSYQPIEKKLEILKDPHAGAFAIITCTGYYLLTFGIWYDLTPSAVPIVAISFVLSRALSGLAIVTFPLAKNTGLAATFSNQAKKRTARITMVFCIVICSAAMLYLNWILGLISILCAGLVYAYYRAMSIKKFGGITGDLAGYFLQICELAVAICVIVGGKLCG